MKIAQVAPIWLKVPPEGYGGAEQIISLLTEELVKRNHETTLFASGDSQTNARLVSIVDKAPGLNQKTMANVVNNMNHLFNMFNVLEHENEFDLIHWHICKDISPIMFIPYSKIPSLITVHNQFNTDEMAGLEKILEHYKKINYVISISNAHRKFYPFDYFATVYNGIDTSLFEYNDKPQNYLVWIGRFANVKGPHIAIQIALKLGLPLKLAAPQNGGEFFKKEIEPYLGRNNIEYVGEVDAQQRTELLKNASAFLNPIEWDEPFGLVVPEANACGTPVVAFARGAMPELIQDGNNGFLVRPDDIDGMVQVIKKIAAMPEGEYRKMRKNCRHHVEENFTVKKMVDGYERVYERVIEDWRKRNGKNSLS